MCVPVQGAIGSAFSHALGHRLAVQQGFLTFFCAKDSAESLVKPTDHFSEKMYLNALNKIHRCRICLYYNVLYRSIKRGTIYAQI
jgi:hypothetical protein